MLLSYQTFSEIKKGSRKGRRERRGGKTEIQDGFQFPADFRSLRAVLPLISENVWRVFEK
jgi:hypothetical protein